MKRTGVLTKVLAIIGTVLVWFPIAATVVTAVAGSITKPHGALRLPDARRALSGCPRRRGCSCGQRCERARGAG